MNHMLKFRNVVVAIAAVIVLSPAVLAQAPSRYHRATISPSVVYLQPGDTQRFKAVIVATRMMAAQIPTEVKWAVNDISGGNSSLGTIDKDGLYTAPASIPSPREIHICAEVPEAANRYLWATVIIGDTPPTYKQRGIWSEPVIEGTDHTEHLEDPHGITLDKDGNVIIADQLGSGLFRYTADGKFLGRIDQGKGSKPGEVTEPRIVGVKPDGRIYVTDSKGDRPRIQVFSHEGEFLQIFAEKGIQPGMLLRCHGLDFDSEGRIVTSDVDNQRITIYSPEGEFVEDWGTEGPNPGQFNAPHGLFLDKNNDVFVTGYYGPTQKFSAQGDFIVAFAHGDPPDGPVYFHNITGDRWGNAYVMVRTLGGYQGAFDTGEGKKLSIVKYNNNGDYITGWSFTASDHRETSAVVNDEGHVYALFEGEKEMGVEIFEEE